MVDAFVPSMVLIMKGRWLKRIGKPRYREKDGWINKEKGGEFQNTIELALDKSFKALLTHFKINAKIYKKQVNCINPF